MAMDRFDRSTEVLNGAHDDGNALVPIVIGVLSYLALGAVAFGLVMIFHHFTR